MTHHVILFDADGMTLVPKRFSEEVQKDFGIPWEKMEPFFSGPFVRCKLGKADLKEELVKVISDWGWRGTVEQLVTYWFGIGSEPNPEVVSIARELRSHGVKCFLATNQEKYRMEYLWNVVGLKDAFDGYLVSADIGHQKDEVAFYEAAYQRISAVVGSVVAKTSVLFVDHEEEKIAAAKEFGFEVYRYEDPEGFRVFVSYLTL
jgi:putative hydrolase of the HAD superfamily